MQCNKICNQVRRETRKLLEKLEKYLSKKAKSNKKVIWDYLRTKSKTKTVVSDLQVYPQDPSTQKISQDDQKANILAEFFSSVFSQEDLIDLPTLPNREILYLLEDLAIEKDVQGILENLKIDKSIALDGIHPRFIRETASTISVPLTILFQQSVVNGEIPNDWRNAEICAIFKNGGKHDAGNYRPIKFCLTSLISKILETIVRSLDEAYDTE